jgi:hypothetical protein
MIMSEQTIPMMAHGRGGVLAGAINTSVAEVIAAFLASRQRRAERAVRATLRDFSAEHLAAYGWAQEDIKRLKSI